MELEKTPIPEFALLDSPLEGTNLIEANAGTGKTYAISKLFLRLILEGKASVDEILVVTFTEAATEELKERIRKDLIAAREAFLTGKAEDPFFQEIIEQFEAESSAVLLRNSLRLFDDVSIFTIHGFCQRSLKENTFESGSLFEMELITDQRELLEEIIDDFWRKNLYTASPEVSEYLLNTIKSTSYFLKLFSQIPLTEKVTVLPKQKTILPEVIGTEKERLASIFHELKAIWSEEGENIISLLEVPELNARSYGSRVRTAVSEMETFLNKQTVPLSLFKTFELFTNEKLESSLKKGATPPNHPFFDLSTQYSEQLEVFEGMLETVLLSMEHDLFAFVQQELRERKQKKNLLYFDDLLLNLNKAVQKDNGNSHLALKLRKLYKAALIDEFQDTDTLQYEIFHTLFGRGEHILFLIGDPKQAIYRFRGADIFAYLDAVRDVENRYSLQTNYRSEGGLINAVNALFSHRKAPFLFEDIHYFPSRSSQKGEEVPLNINGDGDVPLKLCFLSREGKTNETKSWSKEASYAEIVPGVTGEILRLLKKAKKGEATINGRPLVPGDIAILTRSHREAAMVKRSLNSVKVPSVLDSTENIFETEDVETITLLLQAIHEPGSLEKVKAAMTTDALGCNACELENLTEDEVSLESWLIRFEEYHKLWLKRSFITMFRTFLTKENVPQRLLALPGGERRLTNLIHLGELLHRETTTTGKGMGELLKWLAKQRTSLTTPEDHEIRLEKDGNAVRIVTVHKSKGLEYPVVFCPFATSPSKPSQKETISTFHREGGQVVALRSDLVEGASRAVEQELLAENIRLLYVALTRAKNRCYLIVGNINGYETSALSYLLHHREKNDFATKTAEFVKKMSDDEILQDINRLISTSQGYLEHYELFDNGPLAPLSSAENLQPLQCRHFHGKIDSSWKISSFTSLLSDIPADIELPDHDEEIAEDPEAEEMFSTDKKKNIFSFPAGAKAGIFFHDLLENLDFTEQNETSLFTLVTKKLEEHGFESEWKETVVENIRELLQVPLLKHDNELTLSKISFDKRLNELEFYYPLSKEQSSAGLQELCRQTGLRTVKKGIEVEKLLYMPQDGFMKGFIDLIFYHEDRYYLLDWKSNLLGKTLDAYSSESIRQSMVKKLYTLQYHIYTAALHRYLQYRIPDYRYESHFGGVLYIYLRGIHSADDNFTGIFYDKPPLDVIEKLL